MLIAVHCLSRVLKGPYPIVFEKLQDEGDGAAVDAYEQVDAGQGHICSTWDVKYVGHGIHHGRH